MPFQSSKPSQSIYEPEFVQELFNEMSLTYERMNTITSFGFSNRWCRQCVNELTIQPNQVVVDLMTGMAKHGIISVNRLAPMER